jgi:hypothetical protein
MYKSVVMVMKVRTNFSGTRQHFLLQVNPLQPLLYTEFYCIFEVIRKHIASTASREENPSSGDN